MTHEGRVGKRGMGLYAGRRFKKEDIVGKYEIGKCSGDVCQ
jgi:hypothetical protein